MKSVLEWYNQENSPLSVSAETIKEKPEQVKVVSIEKEIGIDSEDAIEIEQDNVLRTEFENCIKAVGVTEYLRNLLTNYVAMTQVPDLDGFKKDKMKSELKVVMDELSRTIAEL
jgi:hypothetical protein